MSKLKVDQKSIFDLLSDKKSDFLIPDYQRPYASVSPHSCFFLGHSIQNWKTVQLKTIILLDSRIKLRHVFGTLILFREESLTPI